MSLSCVKLRVWTDLREVLVSRGQDFWLSCLSGASAADMPDKLATMCVEELQVAEVFTHCFIVESEDIKTESDQLIDEFGLGLRKKRVRSRPESGCVFALVSNSGDTALLRRRSEIPDDDRRLSGEERCRRMNVTFQVTDLSSMIAAANQFRKRFWLTSFTQVDPDGCKKRVGTMTVDNQRIDERFSRCIIAEVGDCSQATEQLTNQVGMGIRLTKVRSRPLPGCVMCLFLKDTVTDASTMTGAAVVFPKQLPVRPRLAHELVHPARGETQVALAGSGRSIYGSGDQVPLQPAPQAEKRDAAQRASASVLGAVDGSKPKAPRVDDVARKRARLAADTVRPAVAASSAQLPMKAPAVGPVSAGKNGVYEDREGDLHYKQVCVLEKKLAALLPTLPRDQITTPLVQARLEGLMQKPAGRLDKFRGDIGRIWRSYLDNKSEMELVD